MDSYGRHHTIGCCVSYGVARPILEAQIVRNAQESQEVVLTGPRGNGKTQLARRAARKIARMIGGDAAVPVEEVPGGCMQQMKALHENCIRSKNTSISKVVIIDGVSQCTEKILRELRRDRPPQWTYIITTLDENLASNCIEVPQLSKDEYYRLCENLMTNRHVIPEDLVEDFHEALDGNPLELVYAVEYLTKTKKTPEDYLKRLQARQACILPKEGSAFKENEYPSSLHKRLVGDLQEILANLQDFPPAVQALRALAFFDHKDIPIEVFAAVFDGNQYEYDVADVLLQQVSTYSLGKVSHNENECRLLTLNKAFQRVLISQMDDQMKKQSLELACKVLVHLCHKDNRDKADYESQVNIEQHVKSVLDIQVVPMRSTGVTILKVWLLSTLGHYYIQTDQISKGEAKLEKAIKTIEKDILNGELRLLDLSETDLIKLFQMTEEQSRTEEATLAIKEFVHSLRISKSDKEKWSSRASELDKHFDNKVTSLNPELYEELVDNKCAIDIDRVVPYFIAEVIATVLYSYGRIFLYNRRDKERKQRALEASKIICQSIEETHNVKLLHTVLVDRNGLLCFKLKTAEDEVKSEERMQKDAEEAVSGYERSLRTSSDRYEHGLLKSIQNEQYHKMVCLRYLLKAHKIIWQVTNQATYSKIEILDCITKLDAIMSDGGSTTGNLQRNTSVQTEIGSALLQFDNKEHLLSAKDRFLGVCEVEKKCKKINYPWMEALEGLVTLAKKWQNCHKKEAIAIAKRVKQELKSYIGRSGEDEGYADNAKSGNTLLTTVKAFLTEAKNQGDETPTNSLKSTGHHPSIPFCLNGETRSEG